MDITILLRDHYRRIDPFVTAGSTLFFGDGHLNLFHFSGGTNRWAARHLGARIELRDPIADIMAICMIGLPYRGWHSADPDIKWVVAVAV